VLQVVDSVLLVVGVYVCGSVTAVVTVVVDEVVGTLVVATIEGVRDALGVGPIVGGPVSL